MRLILLAVIVLTGCADKPEPVAAVRKQPQTVAAPIHLPYGTLTTIEVPIASAVALRERQTCFLWRDSEYKTAALQCPNDRQSYTLDPD